MRCSSGARGVANKVSCLLFVRHGSLLSIGYKSKPSVLHLALLCAPIHPREGWRTTLPSLGKRGARIFFPLLAQPPLKFQLFSFFFVPFLCPLPPFSTSAPLSHYLPSFPSKSLSSPPPRSLPRTGWISGQWDQPTIPEQQLQSSLCRWCLQLSQISTSRYGHHASQHLRHHERLIPLPSLARKRESPIRSYRWVTKQGWTRFRHQIPQQRFNGPKTSFSHVCLFASCGLLG